MNVDNNNPLPGFSTEFNAIGYDSNHNNTSHSLGVVDGTRKVEAVKVSNATNLTVNAGFVYGGAEDCLDMNRGNSCNFHFIVAHPRGKFLTTLKGGASYVRLVVDYLSAHGEEVDIDVGNHSDQAPRVWLDRAKNVSIHIEKSSDGVVYARVLNADVPTITTGNGVKVKWLFPWPWLGVFRWFFVAAWEWVVRPIQNLFKK